MYREKNRSQEHAIKPAAPPRSKSSQACGQLACSCQGLGSRVEGSGFGFRVVVRVRMISQVNLESGVLVRVEGLGSGQMKTTCARWNIAH